MSEETPEHVILKHDYVVNHMFEKLAATFDKYCDILPVLEAIEQEIFSEMPTDPVEGIFRVLNVLKSRKEESVLIVELFENFRDDFYYGLDPRNGKHTGKYYIDSVTD